MRWSFAADLEHFFVALVWHYVPWNHTPSSYRISLFVGSRIQYHLKPILRCICSEFCATKLGSLTNGVLGNHCPHTEAASKGNASQTQAVLRDHSPYIRHGTGLHTGSRSVPHAAL